MVGLTEGSEVVVTLLPQGSKIVKNICFRTLKGASLRKDLAVEVKARAYWEAFDANVHMSTVMGTTKCKTENICFLLHIYVSTVSTKVQSLWFCS